MARISEQFRHHGRVLGVLPTGAGKTVCFTDITRRTAARGNDVVITAHRIEIVQQIAAALRAAGVPHGWIAAGKPDFHEPVRVGMVQTVANRLDTLRRPKLLIVDEAHHATAGTYRRIMEAWRGSYHFGVTATAARTDGTALGECFDAMVVGPSMRELISQGYLADYSYFAPPVRADLSAVQTRGADYVTGELAEAMDKAIITGDAIATYAKHLAGKPAVVFCVSVEHAGHVAEQFSRAGWRAASVDGAMDGATRASRIAAIGDGRLQILTSCDLISEGTDIPAVAGVVLLRPTQSLIIYLQQVGRALRPKADGSHAVILDHVGSFFKFDPPDQERPWSLLGRLKRERATNVMSCPKCYAAFRTAPRCPACGFVFAVKPTKRIIVEREGVLEEITPERLKFLREQKLNVLLDAAKTRDDFEAIRRARGYHRRWTQIQMNLRATGRARRWAA